MGGRSEGEGDALAFIHTVDASSWAVFMQNKLRSDSYKIQSFLHHDPNQNYIQNLFSSVQTCAVLVSPMLLEPQHSGFWSRCIERFNQRTVLLFLGVSQEDLRFNLGTSITQCILSHQWLVVDGSKEAVSNALVKLIEVFESLDSSTLQSLREDYATGEEDCEEEETEEGIYDVPPRPIQQNGVVLVKPEVLCENDCREVLVLMERKAEGNLTMVTESCFGPSREVVMKHVISSAYLAKLPNDLAGKVDFKILSEDEHNVGSGSLCVRSTMDQLHDVLEREANHLTVLCRALGVPGTRGSEREELDSLLAKRLAFSQFPAGLKTILYPEDQATGEQGGSQWPSLLHFAAEFNLIKVCDELLRYPGIIHAACTENCDGLFPPQLAEKNGFTALQKRLMQFVENMRLRRSAADSGISIENLPPPSPHNSQAHLYVNERPPSVKDHEEDTDETNDDYVDMSAKLSYPSGIQEMAGWVVVVEGSSPHTLTAPVPCLRKASDGYAKPRSFSEGCVKTPYAKTPTEARIEEEDSSSKENMNNNNEPPALKPKRSHSTASSSYITPTPLPFLGAAKRPDSASSSDGSDTQEAPQRQEEQGSGSRSSTETLTHSESGGATSGSEQKSEEAAGSVSSSLDSSAGERPASQMSNTSSQDDYEVQPDPVEAEHPVLRAKNKRSKSVQDKISHFFKKIKPARRQHSSSESDLPNKGPKKSIVYSRQSTASTASTSSDPFPFRSSTLGSKGEESERDSGAVCDDFNAQVTMRTSSRDSSSSRNSGKRNGISMQRRVSVRVQRAKNEDISETPTLPSRKSTAEPKETFVSYMK